MPSKTPAQHRAMEAAAHGHSTLGIPASVGREFVAADEKKKKKKPVKKTFTTNSVHVPTALGNEKKKRNMPNPFEISVDINKLNTEQQIVYGWASVTDEGGEVVTDTQGDQIDIADLSKAAHEFMLAHRVGGDMHQTLGIGQVVESLVFTSEVQEALGINLNKQGWWIGMKIHDGDVWKRVKDGELGAFSIGGRAQREEI